MARMTSHVAVPGRARRQRGRVTMAGLSVGLLAGAGLSGLAGSSAASATPVARHHEAPPTTVRIVHQGKLGEILVGKRGMTLYHFTRDAPGKPACSGACLTIWPPLLLAKGATEHPGPGVAHLGVLDRPGGQRQVTFDGEPLYYYSGDAKPGQASGQGIEGLWFVVHPSAAKTKAAPTKPTGTTHGYVLVAG